MPWYLLPAGSIHVFLFLAELSHLKVLMFLPTRLAFSRSRYDTPMPPPPLIGLSNDLDISSHTRLSFFGQRIHDHRGAQGRLLRGFDHGDFASR